MNNGKQPITPTMYTKCGDGADDYQPLKDGQKTGWEVKFGGLTKREYFAGLAMASFFGGEYIGQSGVPEQEIAKRCVAMADALLVELSNGDGQ